MSERGTFITSYLYCGKAAKALAETLPEFATIVVAQEAHAPCGAGDPPNVSRRPVWFSGLVKRGWSGEEAHDAEMWVLEKLLPALPDKHGMFSIVVLPEGEEHTLRVTIHNREVVAAVGGFGDISTNLIGAKGGA